MKTLVQTLSRHRHLPLDTLLRRNLYPQAFQASFSLRDTQFTESIYTYFIKRGLVLDPFLAASVVHHLSRSGHFSHAHKFLLDAHHADVVAWNALISGLTRVGRNRPVFELFNGLRSSGLAPDGFTLSSLIKACDDFRENEAAHGVSLKMGFFSSAFLVSGLVENYARCGEIASAEKCFGECLVLDSVVWTAMISGYVWNGDFTKGTKVFLEMRRLGLELNEFSLTSVLGALYDISVGEQVHGLSVKMGLVSGCSTHLNNALMSMYSRCGSKMDVFKLFYEITDPDVVSWTALIGAACDGVEALELFKFACSSDVEINEVTVINVLSAIGCPELLKPGKQVHSLCHKTGYLSMVSVSNSLIYMYGKCGEMSNARHVFDEMICPDSASWNSLIAGYAESGFSSLALAVFTEMSHSSVQPTEYTLAGVLEVASDSNSMKLAMQIHSLVIKFGFVMVYHVTNCLVMTYGKCNGIEESKRVFSEIDEVNVYHINAMEATFVVAGCHADALKFFENVWNLCFEVDSVTFSTALKACGALTDLERARIIHSLILKHGIDHDNFVESVTIDVYCKCGAIDDAKKLFKNIYEDNVAAWNAMMMGYAQHGFYNEVFELFNKMPDLGIKPDDITYLAVLNSCRHAGLLHEAHTHLNAMFELHGVIPCLEHYACVVDLLGCVGFLEDAKRTIDQMPMSPDAQIWQILLSACHVHGNVDLGEVAARELFKLQHENDSAYILLSNLYASARMWNAVRKLRREMKEKEVHKEPGSSWIQIKGSTHNFHADDISHPQSKEVIWNLQMLNEHMVALPDMEQGFLTGKLAMFRGSREHRNDGAESICCYS